MGRIARWGSEMTGAPGPDTGEAPREETAGKDVTDSVIPVEISDETAPTDQSDPSPPTPDQQGPNAALPPPAPTAHPPDEARNGRRAGALPPRVLSAGASPSGSDGVAGAGAGESGDPAGRRTGTDGAFGVGTAAIRGMTLPLLRVLPLALSADPSWSTLPLGPVGTFELIFTVSESGHVHLANALPGNAPAPMRSLIDQMLRLLSWPRFAVRSSEMGEGIDKVRLNVAITQDTASAEVLAASGGAYGLGADPPNGRQPGKAHCTWANGRRVNVTLTPISR